MTSLFGSGSLAYPRHPCTIGTMVSSRTALIIPAVLFGVSGCAAYDPPVRGDHMSDHYKADLESCRTSSSHAVYIKNADNPWTWMVSPITGPPKVRAAIRTCMQAKGYVLDRHEG
jgi:hypothetical protein